MFTGVREVRGLQVLAAAAPPRFPTNLGFHAEDSRKQAGHRPAFVAPALDRACTAGHSA